jgi:hypothetical protein
MTAETKSALLSSRNDGDTIRAFEKILWNSGILTFDKFIQRGRRFPQSVCHLVLQLSEGRTGN